MEKQVKTLLSIIKIAPALLILIASILIISTLNTQQKKELQEEHKIIEKEFIEAEKERINANISTIYNLIKDENKNIEKELKKKLKFYVNNIYTIIDSIYKLNENKKPKKEIIEDIKKALREVRFNNGRTYTMLATTKAISILQPLVPHREGTYVYNVQDSRGKYPMHEFIKIVNSPKSEGFSEYYFRKPSDKKNEYRKISYIKLFKELDLMIVIGDYINDFKLDTQNKMLKQLPKFKYKKGAHLYIITFNGDIIYHPSPNAMSTNIFKDDKYSHMDYKFKDLMLKKEKDADAYMSIRPKVTEGINTKDIKVNYVKRFDDWEWMIGSNFNISDANYIIEKRKNILEKKHEEYKHNILFYGAIFTILMLILSYFMSKLLEKKFLNYKDDIENQIKENRIQNKKLKSQTLLLNDRTKELETIIQENPHPMILHKEGGEIVMINQAWSDSSGYSLEEIATIDHWVDLVYSDKEVRSQVRKHIHSLYKITEKVDEGEFSFLNKNKKILRWQVSSSPLGIIDGKQTIITCAMDVTELKERESIFFQQSKMAAMGEMLGNIAHQWRQPLSIISTSATGAKVQNEMGLLNKNSINSYFDTINDTAQHLSQTIEDFRSFFNPNNTKREFNISTSVEKTLKLISAQFTTKEIEIIQNIENYDLLSIENDLIQVLINILNNARDALLTKEKSRRLIFINIYQKDNISYIEILDNAGGINSDIIDRIFEPYFTTKHQSIGTGIGLYMSEEIVRNHLNGILTVENEIYEFDGVQYKGAKFTIKIT